MELLKLFLFGYFVILIFGNQVYAQDEDESACPSSCIELIIHTENAAGKTLYFTAEIQSQIVWDYDFSINTNFANSTVETYGNINGIPVADLKGWEFTYAIAMCDGAAGRIGFGLYKIYSGDSFFYIDFRDCRYFKGIGEDLYGQIPDVWLKYNNANGNFYYSVNPCQHGWSLIDNGSTVSIWEIFNVSGNASLDSFQPTNPSDLQIVNSGGYPFLQWIPSIPSVAKYQIYRNNVLVHTTAGGVNTWADASISWRVTGPEYTYKVKGLSADGSRTSNGFSNPITIFGMTLEKKPADSLLGIWMDDRESLAVFPNPFNPEARIRYDVDEPANIVVKVYDILGKEVVTLTNGWKGRGTYEEIFNGTSIKSGVYFCRINIGSKVLIQRMILQK